MGKNTNRLDGHTMPFEGRASTTIRGAGGGEGLVGNGNGSGKTVCLCGAESPVLPNTTARKTWHKKHKEQIAKGLAAPSAVGGDPWREETYRGSNPGEDGPPIWRVRLAGHAVRIAKHPKFSGDRWVLDFGDLIRMHPLEANDLQEAKTEALTLVDGLLASLVRDLDKVTARPRNGEEVVARCEQIFGAKAVASALASVARRRVS